MQWSSVSNLQHSRRSINSLGMILIIAYIISKLRVAFPTLAVSIATRAEWCDKVEWEYGVGTGLIVRIDSTRRGGPWFCLMFMARVWTQTVKPKSWSSQQVGCLLVLRLAGASVERYSEITVFYIRGKSPTIRWRKGIDCCNVRCVVLFFSNMLFWGLVQPIVECPPFLNPRWQ